MPERRHTRRTGLPAGAAWGGKGPKDVARIHLWRWLNLNLSLLALCFSPASACMRFVSKDINSCYVLLASELHLGSPRTAERCSSSWPLWLWTLGDVACLCGLPHGDVRTEWLCSVSMWGVGPRCDTDRLVGSGR